MIGQPAPDIEFPLDLRAEREVVDVKAPVRKICVDHAVIVGVETVEPSIAVCVEAEAVFDLLRPQAAEFVYTAAADLRRQGRIGDDGVSARPRGCAERRQEIGAGDARAGARLIEIGGGGEIIIVVFERFIDEPAKSAVLKRRDPVAGRRGGGGLIRRPRRRRVRKLRFKQLLIHAGAGSCHQGYKCYAPESHQIHSSKSGCRALRLLEFYLSSVDGDRNREAAGGYVDAANSGQPGF